MINKLLSYYSKAVIKHTQPDTKELIHFHWFQSKEQREWIGIPLSDIQSDALDLLKTLFDYYEPTLENTTNISKQWYDFLFSKGAFPQYDSKSKYYTIHFKLVGSEWERDDVELAIKGFFQEGSIIIWYTNHQGVLIDKSSERFADEELFSLIQTFESDFFLKAYLYIGYEGLITKDFPIKTDQDIHMFETCIKLLPNVRLYKFESVFPAILTSNIKSELSHYPIENWLNVFKQDHDLHSTIMVFLENNSNASLTAKKLYIHRNTLQYRLDKFTEKTGINLKDFNSALTVYLACMLFEQQ